MRSSFNAALLQAKVTPQEVCDYMMGHSRGGARDSYYCNEPTVRSHYDNVFLYVSCNGGELARKDIKRMDTTLSVLQEKNVQLENEIKQLRTDVKTLLEAMAKINERITEEKTGLKIASGEVKEA